tara:strand:+ start:710 stop:1525 length:816 start_codon:yes stop_codon:yes gene_type:complete
MIDVVVPIYNPGDNILKICEYLENIPKVKWIYIFDTDKSFPNVKNFKKVKYISIDKKDFHHAKIRNKYIKYSTSEYVIFMTQDVFFLNNSCISKMYNFIKKNDLSALTIRQSTIRKHDPYDRIKRLTKYPNKNFIFQSFSSLINLSNTFTMYDVSIFKMLKGFPTNHHWAEDIQYAELAINKGYKIGYLGETSIKHSHNHSMKDKISRAYLAGGLTRNSENRKKIISTHKTSILILQKAFKISFMLFNIVLLNLFILFLAYYYGRLFKKNL